MSKPVNDTTPKPKFSYSIGESEQCDGLRSKKYWPVSASMYERMTSAEQRCFDNITYFHKQAVEQCWNPCKGKQHLFCWYHVPDRTCEMVFARFEMATPWQTRANQRIT